MSLLRENINANGHLVEIRYQGGAGDFISLTDIVKYRTDEHPGYVIQNWMRNRNTIRFLGLWERLHNARGCVKMHILFFIAKRVCQNRHILNESKLR